MLSNRGPGWFLYLAWSGNMLCTLSSVRHGDKLRPHRELPSLIIYALTPNFALAR